jgi:formylglycine-generating enzyme
MHAKKTGRIKGTLHNRDGMVFIEGGTFRMGSDRHYAEEAPVHRVAVDGFWIDRTPVTNLQFGAFVSATKYVTAAERPLNATDYPGVQRQMLRAASLIFVPPDHLVALNDWARWWRLEFGAYWRRPYGPGSSCGGLDHHPVVHIAYEDALAYANWAGKDLPTEAEWEFAARGGLDGADYAWGDTFMPEGRPMANTWHGHFPHENTKADGFERTSPVGNFPPNGYGLFDMIGNVWEWTSGFYSPKHRAEAPKACCIAHNPRNLDGDASGGRNPASSDIPCHVIKGGSHLCAPNYCQRFRPSARQGQPVDSATSHIGFRCVVRKSAEI